MSQKEKEIEIEKEERKAKEEKGKKKRVIILLLLLLLLCIFGISITFGKGIYESIADQIIEVLNLRKPSEPVITGGSEEWAKERLIRVEKDAEAKDGLAYYEYCIREEKSTKKCEWKKTETKNVKVIETGIYYVTFRAVDQEERRGYDSNTEVVYIDNQNPVIEKVRTKGKTTNSIRIEVEAKDKHSGIEGYYYSLDGKEYEKGNVNYTYRNLERGKEYEMLRD